MARFVHESHYDHPREAVFGWHERPGAFLRLTPALMGRGDSDPSDGIRGTALRRVEHRFGQRT